MNKLDKLPANVRYNDDAEYVKKLLDALEKRGGYCPCRLQRVPENICICQEFKAQIADPDFEGLCHCKLFYKEK